MKSVLTPEEKKTLRYISRYLRSYGLDDGSLESEGFDQYEGPEFDKIDVEEWTHFSNNWKVEVPSELYPILEKALKAASQKYENLEVDTGGNDINYGRVDIDIDTKKQEISVNYWFSYYDTAGGPSITIEEEEDDSITEILDMVEEVCSGYNEVELRYNGGGDSGYIEDNFEEPSEGVPANVEDYCYRWLNGSYGGWEINEGSQGSFIFDLKNRQITLHHTYNTEESQTYTLFEEKFGN